MPNYRYHFGADALLLHPVDAEDGSFEFAVRFEELGSDRYIRAVTAPSAQQSISIVDAGFIKMLIGDAAFSQLRSIETAFSYQNAQDQWSSIESIDVEAKLLNTEVVIAEPAGRAILTGERQETKPIEIEFHVVDHPLVVPFAYVHLSRDFLFKRFKSSSKYKMMLTARNEARLCGAKVPIGASDDMP